MKKINIKLSMQGIDKAIAQLEKYRDSIEPKAKEVCVRLAERGIPIVTTSYHARQAEDPTDTSTFDVTVNEMANGKGATLTASGEKVYFYEFGAGVWAGENYPPERAGGMDISPGSWSRTHGGRFDYINRPYWEHGGYTFSGFHPAKGMLEAEKNIEKTAEKELKRAFK